MSKYKSNYEMPMKCFAFLELDQVCDISVNTILFNTIGIYSSSTKQLNIVEKASKYW